METGPYSQRAALALGVASDRKEIRPKLDLLCKDLHRTTGMLIYPHIVPSYRQLEKQIVSGLVEVAWAPPLVALELEDVRAGNVIACAVRDDVTSYFSALIAHPESHIRSVAEFDGQRVAWVAKQSLSGYIVPRAWIASSGIDPERLFAEELFLESHDAVIDAVMSGRCTVGATHAALDPASGDVLRGAWSKRGARVDVVATAGPIPSDTIVVSRRVPPGARGDLTTAFLSPSPTARSMFQELFQTASFKRADPSHLASLRRMPGLSRDHRSGRPSVL